jgi:CheY-like chemotaxis protein
MAKVLVIEDEAISRSTICGILAAAGHVVETAENGRLGIASFRRNCPDLVITDVIMPEQEGIQTLIDIRRMNPKAKVIVISGGGRSGSTALLGIAKKLGAADVISKPFDPPDLLRRIAAALG